MRIGSMVRSGITEHTAGYGNTRTGVAMTEDFLADNEICEGDFVKKIMEILELPPGERDEHLNAMRDWWLSHHANGGKNYHIAINRFNGMVTQATYGSPGIRRIIRGTKKKKAA